jgi:hypothetical protein
MIDGHDVRAETPGGRPVDRVSRDSEDKRHAETDQDARRETTAHATAPDPRRETTAYAAEARQETAAHATVTRRWKLTLLPALSAAVTMTV